MIRRPRCRAASFRTATVAGALLAALVTAPVAAAPPADEDPPAPDPVAPYLSLGWGDPPDPVKVMKATGVRWFTLAFVLSTGKDACRPRWDGRRPLTGGKDQAAVRAVRKAGGDVVVSFGGGRGRTLERNCSDARSLARAYQRVIDAYELKAIDIDIETAALRDKDDRQKTIDALKRVTADNPALTVYMTLPTGTFGPDAAIIKQAAKAKFEPDVWSVMPFSFGKKGWGKEMALLTLQAAEGLTDRLSAAYGYNWEEAHRRAGVSSMAGITGAGEVITVRDFRALVDYAEVQKLGRLTFWSVNRDRKCPDDRYPSDDTCSGVGQRDWAYTRILATYGKDG